MALIYFRIKVCHWPSNVYVEGAGAAALQQT